MPRKNCSGSESERAACGAPSGACGTLAATVSDLRRPHAGRETSACSDKCRAAKSRRQRSKAQAERDRRVLELL